MLELITILAVWKATEALISYDGPFNLFMRFRRRTNFTCFFCLSFWIALPFALILSQDWTLFIYWFGLSGGASLINELDDLI